MASEAKICQGICNILGCLPLAIFLVGRYMAHKRQLASEYLAWLEKTSLIALDLGKRQHQSIPLLMEHSLLQVSEQAQSCLGLTGALALKPFEPGIIAIALEVSVEEANHSLGDLVDFGLLTRPDVRYQITHALAHTYARERLAPPGNSLTRLAEYYDDFIHKETQLGLCGYVLLDGQRDHILAVQSACNKAGLWKAVRTLAWAIEDYLDLQGHWVERIAILQAGLVAARSDEARYDEASFFNSLGLAYRDMGEPRKAIEYYEQAQKIAREIGYRRGEGYHLGNLGNAYRNLGEPRKAIEYLDQAQKIFRVIGDRMGEGIDLGNLGLAYSDLGEPRKAIEYYEQALKIFREIGSMRGEGTALGNLGLAYFALGQSFKAIEYYEQALKIFREIGDRRGEGTALGNLGNAYSDLGQPSKAIEYHDQTLKIAREMGDRSGEARASWNLGLEYETAGDLRRAADLMQVDIEFKRKIGHPDAEKDAEYLENLRARIEKK
jgi:tetratricopeptide (TPR) repeat protein